MFLVHIAPKPPRRKRRVRTSLPPGTRFLRCRVNTTAFYDFVPISTYFGTQLGFLIGPLGPFSLGPSLPLIRHLFAVVFGNCREDTPMDWD